MLKIPKKITPAILASFAVAGLSTFFVKPARAVVTVVPGFITQNGDGTWNCDCTGGIGCQCKYNKPPAVD